MSILPKSLSLETLKAFSDDYNINPVFLEKDWYTQHVLGVIAGIQSDDAGLGGFCSQLIAGSIINSINPPLQLARLV